MAKLVCMGATLQCTFGAAPSSLLVLPTSKVMVENKPAATIMDMIPIKNIPPFGMCSSAANPTVISATAAAQGVFTPMPCLPVIPAPWAPPATKAMVGSMPALLQNAKCMCTWGGVISINMPGAIKSDGT